MSGSDLPSLPVIATTMGDPAGIGPEIIVKTAGDPQSRMLCRMLVLGNAKRLEKAVEICGIKLRINHIQEAENALYRAGVIDCIDVASIPEDLPFGVVSKIGGEAAFKAVEKACELSLEGRVDAICTAPLNKEALREAGHNFPGHTELLAYLTGTHEVSMMLVSPKIRVIHVTTHIGILDMVELIEPGLVFRTIERGYWSLRAAGIHDPRIAVCGINPHAGEHGLFGRAEEEVKVFPAVRKAEDRGFNVEGPLPADSVFFRAGRGDFDLVVAMYHDQGHGPIKVMGLDSGVNVTVGLPVVRTSVDHGTAFDIAGTGVADHRSMIEALRQAAQFCRRSSKPEDM